MNLKQEKKTQIPYPHKEQSKLSKFSVQNKGAIFRKKHFIA